jgi:hypothetical protein
MANDVEVVGLKTVEVAWKMTGQRPELIEKKVPKNLALDLL